MISNDDMLAEPEDDVLDESFEFKEPSSHNNYGADISHLITEHLKKVKDLDTKSNACLNRLSFYFAGLDSLEEVCKLIPSITSKEKKEEFNLHDLLTFLHKTAKLYEMSKDISYLQFSALLKRIAKFLSGKSALKEI